MKSNIAIIGCGKIAQRHASAISLTEGLELIVAVDSKIERAKDLVTEYGGIPFDNYFDILNNHNVDLAIISTPNGTHNKIASDFIRAGKHVLIEKPIAMNYSDALELLQLGKKHRVRVFSMHQHRFERNIELLRSEIKNGSWGLIRQCNITLRWNRSEEYYTDWRGTRLLDGGILLSQAIHFIDILQWLVGPIENLFSFSQKINRNIETKDTFVAALRFKDGFLGALEISTAIMPQNIEASIAIFTDKVSFKIGGTHLNKLEWFAGNKNIELFDFETKDSLFQIAYSDIKKSLMLNVASRIDISEIISVMKTLDALKQSSALIKVVNIQ